MKETDQSRRTMSAFALFGIVLFLGFALSLKSESAAAIPDLPVKDGVTLSLASPMSMLLGTPSAAPSRQSSRREPSDVMQLVVVGSTLFGLAAAVRWVLTPHDI